ncbi:MAG: phospholipase D-like domain-containing protein, partial [Chloroflexota bacterium]
FLPVRRILGPFHRSSQRLDDERVQQERNLPPLPTPWDGDDRWYRGGFPPRAHNKLTPLPHGDAYFKDLLEVLKTARRRVTIAVWCLTPLMDLANPQDSETFLLGEMLHQTSRHAEVLVLLWSGAPALFEPNVHYVKEVRRILLGIAPEVGFQIDDRAAFSHDHHQKAVTVDGRVGYVGGIDLTTFQGNRWDTARHTLRFGPNWHDIQVRLEGEVVGDVEANFCERWNAVTGRSDLRPLEPVVDESWNEPAQIVRTVPRGFYPFAPSGEYGIRHALLAGIRSAQRFIYLENQYLWAPEIIEALCERLNHAPDPFRITIVLPADAYSGKYDNDRHVRLMRRADAGRGRFEAYSLWTAGPASSRTGHQYRSIYVHAKVAIVDDAWFIAGSANLNMRGIATDTEMDVQAPAPEVARRLRVQLWSEHLGMSEEEISAADPIDLIDNTWKQRATDMAAAVKRETARPRGQILRYAAGRSVRDLLLDRFESATLEH